MNLHGAIGVVTGAGGGIGSALTRRFVENGARIVMTDIDESLLAAASAPLSAQYPDRVSTITADASQTEDIRAVIAEAERAFVGPVDLYAANAGVVRGSGLTASADDWKLTLEVNVLAHVRAAEIIVPQWIKRGRGYFLSTASAAGLLTQLGSATYAVTKHAAVGFAEWLAITYGGNGIEVGCLCPMGVRTAMLTAGAEAATHSEVLAARAVTEAGDVLDPLDVADAVIEGMARGEFLILPHPQVREFFIRKAADHARWIKGMRRYQETLS